MVQWSFDGTIALGDVGDVGVVGTFPDGIFLSFYQRYFLRLYGNFVRYSFVTNRLRLDLDALCNSHVNKIITCRSTFRFVFRNQFVRSAFGLCNWFNWWLFFLDCSLHSILLKRWWYSVMNWIFFSSGSNGTQSTKWISKIFFACDTLLFKRLGLKNEVLLGCYAVGLRGWFNLCITLPLSLIVL